MKILSIHFKTSLFALFLALGSKANAGAKEFKSIKGRVLVIQLMEPRTTDIFETKYFKKYYGSVKETWAKRQLEKDNERAAKYNGYMRKIATKINWNLTDSIAFLTTSEITSLSQKDNIVVLGKSSATAGEVATDASKDIQRWVLILGENIRTKAKNNCSGLNYKSHLLKMAIPKTRGVTVNTILVGFRFMNYQINQILKFDNAGLKRSKALLKATKPKLPNKNIYAHPMIFGLSKKAEGTILEGRIINTFRQQMDSIRAIPEGDTAALRAYLTRNEGNFGTENSKFISSVSSEEELVILSMPYIHTEVSSSYSNPNGSGASRTLTTRVGGSNISHHYGLFNYNTGELYYLDESHSYSFDYAEVKDFIKAVKKMAKRDWN